MNKALIFAALTVAVSAPAAAQSTTGIDAMQYYVGTWSCVAGPVGGPQSKATATYTIDSGLLRESVLVPMQGAMKMPYAISSATMYDAKNSRYVQTFLDNTGGWSISFAKPWTGNTEEWIDQSSYDGKLGHGETVRTDQNSFSFAGFPSMTAATPDFKGTCTRST